MSHIVHAVPNKEVHQKQSTFLTRFKKNFLIELKSGINNLSLAARLIFISIFGFVLFIFEFKTVLLVVGVVGPPLLFYVVGKYFTLLPMYLVLPLMFIPNKMKAPVLGLSVLASIFIVFLI